MIGFACIWTANCETCGGNPVHKLRVLIGIYEWRARARAHVAALSLKRELRSAPRESSNRNLWSRISRKKTGKTERIAGGGERVTNLPGAKAYSTCERRPVRFATTRMLFVFQSLFAPTFRNLSAKYRSCEVPLIDSSITLKFDSCPI